MGLRLPGRNRHKTPVIAAPASEAPADGGSYERKLKREIVELRLIIEQMQHQIGRRDQLAGLGRLVAGVAREIGNPLARMARMHGTMRSLIAEPKEGGPVMMKDIRDQVLECERAAEQMSRLVTSLRDMGGLTADEDVVFDPAPAIRNAVRLFAAAKRGECRVNLRLSALPAVSGSPGQLSQVIVNLLQNGLDASDPDGRLEVSADSVDGDLRILVSDHGHGVPPELVPRLFERFFTTNGKSGLGLTISRDIVNSMKGRIEFEGGPEGTTFRIVIPGHFLNDKG